MIVLIHLLNALASGTLLALTALGLTMIFGFLNVVNFAHGAIYMLGAYFAFAIVNTLHSFWLALILSPILVGLIGIILERFWLRKLVSKDPVYSMLLTFGLALIIENAVKMVWGTSNHSFSGPAFLQGSIDILGFPYPAYRLFVIVFSALICIILYTLLHHTKVGIRVRAGTEDREMASALGINTKTLGMFVFGGGCSLAAAAGVVAGPYLSLTPDMGGLIIITTFIVITIGGMGNLAGVIVSALLVGFIQTIGSIFMPDFAMVFVYAVMILILIINDKGISALIRRPTH
jgi:branched-subunit amino acid ABC-type transport system permease component